MNVSFHDVVEDKRGIKNVLRVVPIANDGKKWANCMGIGLRHWATSEVSFWVLIGQLGTSDFAQNSQANLTYPT